MKNYISMIDNETLNSILDEVEKYNIDSEFWQGSLQDNWLLYNHGVIKLDDIGYKYIMIREKYLTPNSSGLEMIATDDDDFVREWTEAMNDADSVECIGCGQVLRYCDMEYIGDDKYICGQCDAHICPHCENLIFDEPCDYCEEQRRIEIYNRQCDYIDWFNSRM